MCKFDFKSNSAKVVSEAIDNDLIKSIKKSTDETYKKTGDLAFGKLFDFEVKHMAEYGGVITVSFGDKWAQESYQIEGSTIINGYDEEMNQKFQQVMATNTVYGPTSNTKPDYHFQDNKLCMTANTGNIKLSTIYGQLDLNTGKWITFKKLEKSKIDGSDFITDHNLWYPDSFILIYVPFTHSFGSKINLSMQQNSY